MIRALTIAGGASAYTPGLMKALVQHARQLDLREVRLYDVAHDRLELVARLCGKMAEANGAKFSVLAQTDLEAALVGTDAVLNSTRPGGFECRRLDETLPLEFDVPGQETVGPGGFFFALRSVPEALHLASALRRVAPKALLLNYTNPTNIVTQALVDQGYDSAIGLCDQSDEDLEAIDGALGAGTGEWSFRCVGLNHATWYTDIELSGVRLDLPPPPNSSPGDRSDEKALRLELSFDLARETPGYWPNSYLPYLTSAGSFVSQQKRSGPRTDEIVASLPGYYQHFAEEAGKDVPNVRRHRGTAGFGDLAVRMLLALSAKRPTKLVVNTVNAGAVAELDRRTVVETRVEVCEGGCQLEPSPPPPPRWVGLMTRLEEYQRLAAQAAVNGDRGALETALAANPLVPSRAVAERMITLATQLYGARIPAFG